MKRAYNHKEPLNIKPDIAKAIRAERVRQKATQEMCASKAGLSASHWCQLEQGLATGRMSLATADRVAAGLGKTLAFFNK
jgi:transcriptional regulator with XRE-family HTH domain